MPNRAFFILQPGIRWGKQLYKMGMGRKFSWGKEVKFSYFFGDEMRAYTQTKIMVVLVPSAIHSCTSVRTHNLIVPVDIKALKIQHKITFCTLPHP